MSFIIRDFAQKDADAFLSLNRYWIDKYFVYEPSDQAQLTDPQGAILDKGGVILIAEADNEAVGTIAIIPKPELGEGTVEMVKMSVRPDQYGKGMGKALVKAVIARARDIGAHRIWLETNSKLHTATHIYHSFGFKDLSDTAFIPTKYARCNLQMELMLDPNL